MEQTPDDLDPLALTYRKVADKRLRIHRQAISISDFPRPVCNCVQWRFLIQRQCYVFRRRQRVEQ